MWIPAFLRGLPKAWLIALALALVAVIGAVDYLTGPELSFSIFYLLPVSLAAWESGRRPGLLVALVGSATWLAADLSAGQVYSHAAIPYWNALVRLALFAVVATSLAALKSTRIRQDELSQFIIHDLRSPLGNVISGLETMRDVAGADLDPTQDMLIQATLSSANRMLTLINSLLDLAKLEYGKMPVRAAELAVADLVSSSMSHLTNMAARKEVTLRNEATDGSLRVHADPDLTTRILVNLLSNAVGVSQSGKAVVVHTARTPGGEITFRVVDSGPGIPAKAIGKVFDKFGQIEMRKEGGYRGSGLGLAFSKLAVEVQGGRIWMESEVGQGTTVSFTLPAAVADRA